MMGNSLNLKARFWRFAHNRYQTRRPNTGFETAAFLCGGLFLFVYVASFVTDFQYTLRFIPGFIAFVVLPLTIGFLHRRIRIERAKGSNALYRKRLETTR